MTKTLIVVSGADVTINVTELATHFKMTSCHAIHTFPNVFKRLSLTSNSQAGRRIFIMNRPELRKHTLSSNTTCFI